jgi:hypothetical protein
MATDSITPKPLDIEALNKLATRLRDTADVIMNPGVRADINTAASVASEHAHWRFVVAEVAAALPLDNPAKKELLTLIGKEG